MANTDPQICIMGVADDNERHGGCSGDMPDTGSLIGDMVYPLTCSFLSRYDRFALKDASVTSLQRGFDQVSQTLLSSQQVLVIMPWTKDQLSEFSSVKGQSFKLSSPGEGLVPRAVILDASGSSSSGSSTGPYFSDELERLLGYNSGFTEIPSNGYMFEAFTSSINGNPVFKEEYDLNTKTHYGIAPPLSVSASACTDNDMRRKRGSPLINEMNTKRGKASIGGDNAVNRQPKVQPMRRSQKLGDRVTALQQLVSPFGKQLLSSPYFDRNRNLQQGGDDNNGGDLRSRGLCLVPISSTASLTSDANLDHLIKMRSQLF
ncbi:hypothetical protein QJS10_CPB20g00993 [Acorus calamus]|uniref:Uncharacterized protein n=1 Tax=Acorus calamus TaxID=4465 RepID=A0AAV9C9D0_ACOCL|nr:hypothetical protein QJS10_CPB20g00993 [Acorus calamus]